MAISFQCVCGKKLSVADKFAGKRARCPACANVVIVPVAVPEPVAVAAETPYEVSAPPPPPPAPYRSTEDDAFNLLNEGEDQPPAPRTTAAPSRRWDAEEDEDRKPYRAAAETQRVPSNRNTAPDIPKFKAKKVARREARERERPRITLSAGVIASIGGIVLFGGLSLLLFLNDRYSIWLLILLGGSVINLIKGFLGYEED